MRDSERYQVQAESVMRLAARAHNEAEREVYLSIAAGWRRLAVEARRHETATKEERSFLPKKR